MDYIEIRNLPEIKFRQNKTNEQRKEQKGIIFNFYSNSFVGTYRLEYLLHYLNVYILIGSSNSIDIFFKCFEEWEMNESQFELL